MRQAARGISGQGTGIAGTGTEGRQRQRARWGLAGLLLALAALFALLGGSGGPGVAQAQAVSSITFDVRDAQTGDPVPYFKWEVTLDNSHENASVTNPESYSPVVASGDVDDLPVSLPGVAAPNRGYLVTILANDGVGTLNDPDYKLGGTHFNPDGDATVLIELQPNPLPLATLKVLAFHDNGPVNAAEDVPVEDGLSGFHVILHDPLGEVVTDWYGNPICTKYQDLNPPAGFGPEDVTEDGPVPVPGQATQGAGFCLTGSDGYVTIPNLGPDKYEVQAIPPDGSGWIQTTTIEGSPAIDAWVHEGSQGFGLEKDLLPSPVWFGYVKACQFGNASDTCTSATANTLGSRTITGRIRSAVLDTDAPGPIDLGNVVVRPYISLSNIGGDDEQVYTARGNADGTFTIPNVPQGLYQMAVWDKPLDYIIQFFTVDVPGGSGTVGLGDLGVPRWWGTIKGSVYIDQNENGIRDPGEVGFPNQDLDTRFKDGTIQYATFSDRNGNYEFPEVFELEHFAIAEVGYGRFKNTGAAAYATDDFGNPVGYPSSPINQDLGLAGLLQSEITWAGLFTYIDWGKRAFAPGENGGIVGIVFNDVTRNELDAALQGAEDYAPGIPGATVNLWAPQLDENGDPVYDADTGEVLKDHLANTYVTDSWYDSRPTDCIPKGSIGRAPDQVQPFPSIWDDCLELPAVLNQTRPGVFDGGYAFEDDCSNPAVPGNTDPAQLLDAEAGECVTLPAGKWITEVVPPDGYKSVKEEDINVFSGDTFVPQIPPPPCVGPLHTVHVTDDPADANFDPADPSHTAGVYNPDFLATTSALAPDGGSPYEGQRRPICNERLIDLQNGQNANSDFMVFTDVPPPGKVRGLLLDDLTLELDPSSPMYAEKRGIPNAPIGVLDFAGKEVARTMSDENGYWELTLPSTGTYNCPLPAGPCPAVYQFVGNYPGTPDNPTTINPNYAPLVLDFDIWPGQTTVADVATLPITAFVSQPGSQFETPPVCDQPQVPELQQVSDVVADPGDTITITGANLGGATLDGSPITTSGGGGSLLATIPGGTTPGPHQLLVTGGGSTSTSGITIHVIGAGYNPPQRHVGPGQTYATIQAALDAANDGDLVLVHPGTYYENVIVDEKLKLQGYGPGASEINGIFFNFQGITSEEFAAKVNGLAYDGPTAVPQGQAVTVLAENGEFTSDFNAQIDGFKLTSGTGVERTGILDKQGGAIYVHAYANYLQISNNLVQSSAGIYGGGIILGRPYVDNPDSGNARDNQNDFVRIDHNRVLNNGGVRLAGGIALFNGANDFTIEDNIICGNYSAEYGGGISLFGKSSGTIRRNDILFNYAFDEGGGVMIAGEEPPNIENVSAGTGNVTIARNRVEGNVSNDDGGGIRLLAPVDGHVSMANNMIVANLATDSGGGIALDDALSVDIVNNTVARNVSTATAEDADRTSCNPGPNATCPHGAGIVSEGHSAALLEAIADGRYDCAAVNCTSDFTDPVLFNDVIWQNQAYSLDGTIGLLGGGLPSAGFLDLEVLEPGRHFSATWSDCTVANADCPAAGANNLAADPQFAAPVDPDFQALAFAGDPSFVTVLLNWGPGSNLGNFHIAGGSPAIDAGTTSSSGVTAPADDFDGQARGCPDQGADEAGGNATCGTPPPPTPVLIQYMSLNGTGTVGGLTWADEDVIGYDGTSWATVLDGSDVGAGGGRNIDALVMLDADSFLLSYAGPTTLPLIGSTVDDSDIVRFDATTLGSTTAGTFSMYFDGSDVGLTTNAEDVDALEINGAGALLVSTTGDAAAGGVTSVGQDVRRFAPTSLGTATSGTWTLRFDGSDVGLTAGGENIDALALDAGNFDLSTTGGFTVPRPGPDLSGQNDDVFVCVPISLGPTTACTWSPTLAFNGGDFGLGPFNLDAYERRVGVLP